MCAQTKPNDKNQLWRKHTCAEKCTCVQKCAQNTSAAKKEKENFHYCPRLKIANLATEKKTSAAVDSLFFDSWKKKIAGQHSPFIRSQFQNSYFRISIVTTEFF